MRSRRLSSRSWLVEQVGQRGEHEQVAMPTQYHAPTIPVRHTATTILPGELLKLQWLPFVPPTLFQSSSERHDPNLGGQFCIHIQDGKPVVAIYRIQNIVGRTCIDIREHTKELHCRPAIVLEGKGLEGSCPDLAPNCS